MKNQKKRFRIIMKRTVKLSAESSNKLPKYVTKKQMPGRQVSKMKKKINTQRIILRTWLFKTVHISMYRERDFFFNKT